MDDEVNNAKANLSILLQSDAWRIICRAIDGNISRLDRIINDDAPGCEVNDNPIYTGRILNIKQKKILQTLKALPEKLIQEMTNSFSEEDVLKGVLEQHP